MLHQKRASNACGGIHALQSRSAVADIAIAYVWFFQSWPVSC
ncbi:Unknown protein sequence [Pseudomonas amygdali pv. morsprunorum]|nr:Unknown protein sequence [Pseudomonas amygdali pv. morsprunorum]